MKKSKRNVILGLVGATMLALATGCSNTDDSSKEKPDKDIGKSEVVDQETPKQEKVVVTDELREKFEYDYVQMFEDEEEVVQALTDGDLKNQLVDKAIEEGFDYLQVGQREITTNSEGQLEGFLEGGISTLAELEEIEKVMENLEDLEEAMKLEVTVFEANVKEGKLVDFTLTKTTVAEQLEGLFGSEEDIEKVEEE